MTWFRVDDQLPDHRKVRKLGVDRLPAMGLWTLCGAWASGKTDGFVPDEVVTRYDPDHTFAKRLAEVELWTIGDDEGEPGYWFHDWLDYRSSREQEDKKRTDTRRRVQAFRGRKRAEQAKRNEDGSFEVSDDQEPEDDDPWSNAPSNALQGAGSNATCNPAPDPTRPVRSEGSRSVGGPVSSKIADAIDDAAPEEQATTKQPKPRRDDVEAVCKQFAHCREVQGGVRPKITEGWRESARLMLDKDGRDLEKTLRLIEWSQQHHHWHGRVKALPRFREEYGAIRKQALREWERERGGTGPTGSTTDRRVEQNEQKMAAMFPDSTSFDQLELTKGTA